MYVLQLQTRERHNAASKPQRARGRRRSGGHHRCQSLPRGFRSQPRRTLCLRAKPQLRRMSPCTPIGETPLCLLGGGWSEMRRARRPPDTSDSRTSAVGTAAANLTSRRDAALPPGWRLVRDEARQATSRHQRFENERGGYGSSKSDFEAMDDELHGHLRFELESAEGAGPLRVLLGAAGLPLPGLGGRPPPSPLLSAGEPPATAARGGDAIDPAGAVAAHRGCAGDAQLAWRLQMEADAEVARAVQRQEEARAAAAGYSPADLAAGCGAGPPAEEQDLADLESWTPPSWHAPDALVDRGSGQPNGSAGSGAGAGGAAAALEGAANRGREAVARLLWGSSRNTAGSSAGAVASTSRSSAALRPSTSAWRPSATCGGETALAGQASEALSRSHWPEPAPAPAAFAAAARDIREEAAAARSATASAPRTSPAVRTDRKSVV
eukprot:TRINITY_DN7796_c0_g1_i1.p1 TRINITY_DN7796_c0_g1~~TRINITY_DN7796_c0_g1_i1.p1  ORF type:complete len:439 (-),score=78.37 TRINITY_DN7796_c0_g1_i1:77-1393(-)